MEKFIYRFVTFAMCLPIVFFLIYDMVCSRDGVLWDNKKLDKASKFMVFLMCAGMLASSLAEYKGNTTLGNYIFYIIIIIIFALILILNYPKAKTHKFLFWKTILAVFINITLIIVVDRFYKPLTIEYKVLFIFPAAFILGHYKEINIKIGEE